MHVKKQQSTIFSEELQADVQQDWLTNEERVQVGVEERLRHT